MLSRDYLGTTTTVTDQSLRKRSGITDAIGRLFKVNEDPTGVNYETTYVYDVLGRLRKTTQTEGQTTQNRYFMYNDLGRLIRAKQPEQIANSYLSMTDPITGNSNWSVAYNYDNNGNISSTTDANNKTITGTYDNLNRLIFRDYSDSTPDTTFIFDDPAVANSKAQLTAVTNSVSSTFYTAFDELGRVKSSGQTTNGQTYNMPNYTYDLSGALVAQTYPSLRVVTTETDNIGRLSQVLSQMPNQSQRTYASHLSYTSFGAVEKMKLGNGAWESAQFDNKRLQVKQIGLGASNSDTSYLKLEYDYGTTNNNGALRQQKINFSGMSAQMIQNYSYDSLNRLQSATETANGNSTPTWKQTFGYDRFGNRRFDANNTTTLTANNGVYNPNIDLANNRFTVAEGYNYDNEGNLTASPDNQSLFAYDAANHQTQVQNASGTMSYIYDGNGKRVRKVTGNQETVLVYDAFGKMVAEYTTNQTITTEGTKYLTTDALGTPRAITDNSGHVISRHDYMPFGEELTSGIGARTDPQGYKYNSDGIKQQFTGYERDVESGLDYAQARYFSSKHGRFTSVDPLSASASIKNPQTFNRYSYAMNSPYKFNDPLGLTSKCVSGGGQGSTLKACEAEDNDDLNPESKKNVKERSFAVDVKAEADPLQEYSGPATFASDEKPNTYNWYWTRKKEGPCGEEFGGFKPCYTANDFTITLDDNMNKMLNDLYAESFSYYYSLEILDAIKGDVGGDTGQLTVSVEGKIGFTGEKSNPVTGEVSVGASKTTNYISVLQAKTNLNTALMNGGNFRGAAEKMEQLSFVNPRTGKTEMVTQAMARDMVGTVKGKAQDQARTTAADWVRRTHPK